MADTGKVIVFAGIILVVIGLVIWISGDKFGWFGHLPGDIRIVRKNFTFYFPMTSMILISIALTLIMWIIRKLF